MRNLFNVLSLSAVIFLGVTETRAQDPAPPPYCEAISGFDQFDFWIGDWDVYFNSEARPLVGHNTISRRANGCLIFEEWVNARGSDGYSLRHFNPATATWQMFWVADGYTVKTEGAEVEPGVVLLEGDIHYFDPELITGFRVRFTALEDGTVRQFAEQFNPETEEWDLWFDGIYERSAAEEEPQ